MPKNETKLTAKMNWLDRTIGFFSPNSLIKRRKARLYNAYLVRKYEGADSGRRTSGWNTNNQSANAEIATALNKLRDRSRDLVRNNPYAARGAQVITNNVVGPGILTQIKIDKNQIQSEQETRLNNIWNTWAGTTACDYDEIHTMAGLQSLAIRSVVESGEVFFRRRRVGRKTVEGADGTDVELPPIQLQILEADFLSTTKRSGILPNGNQIIQGIEIDARGKRVAYHFFQEHPGGNDIVFGSRFQTVRVLAKDVLHIKRIDRPGQLRGVPWLAPVMLRLRDFDIYEDAQLKRQQCAAMFTAFIHDLAGADTDENPQDVELGEKLEPGMMEILPPGKDITLSNPPSADNYHEYTSVVLHSISAGLGITNESMTGDLTDVNFTSGRMGFLEMHRNFETWRKNIVVGQMMTPTFGWFKEGLDLIGENIKGARAVHTPPRREMIDPVKETQALKMAIRSGIKTLPEAIRETGHDPDQHFAEIQETNETLDKLEIILDTDPRKVDNTGGSNEDVDDDPEKDTNNENKD